MFVARSERTSSRDETDLASSASVYAKASFASARDSWDAFNLTLPATTTVNALRRAHDDHSGSGWTHL